MLELILQGFGALALCGTGLVIIWAGLQARHERPAPPSIVTVELSLWQCNHCERTQVWGERLPTLTCMCGGVYRPDPPRVLREAEEIVRQAG